MRGGRSLAAGLALAAAAVAGPIASVEAAAAAPTVPASFVLSGSGFGHGVGLSQYGARGMASAGHQAADILRHYYTGAVVGPVGDTGDIAVNVLHRVPGVDVALAALAPGASLTVRLADSGAIVPTTSVRDRLRFSVSGTRVGVSLRDATGRSTAKGSSGVVEVLWSGTRRLPGSAALADVAGPGKRLGDSAGRYRHGSLRLRVRDGLLEVVNLVRLHDEYLYGIGEMPSSWPREALRAQAAVSRTYALYHRNRGLRTACDCHVYDGVTHQVFAGWAKESEPIWGAAWVAAVASTAFGPTVGLGVTHRSTPIPAYFFSSSGGRTQNSEDVWGAALPYARGVPDPWSLDRSVNPSFAAWSRTVSQSALASAFGIPDVVALDFSERTRAGAVAWATATSSGGARATISGEQLRSRLRLPSTWVHRLSERLGGADRWSTAVAAGRVASPTGRTVVVVNGTDGHLVDGVVAAPLARKLGAPILLTGARAMPAVTAADIRARQARTAVVVGSPGVVSEAVLGQLRDLGVTSVRRVSGRDRWATAAAVAMQVGAPEGAAFLAAGAEQSLSDAVAVSGIAAHTGRPILLTAREAVPRATAGALIALGVRNTTVVGGPGAVSDAALTALPTARRIGGATRWETAAALVAAFRDAVPGDRIAVVAGSQTNLVDALAAGPLGRLTLLVAPTGAPTETTEALRRSARLHRLQVVGGAGAVPSAVIDRLEKS